MRAVTLNFFWCAHRPGARCQPPPWEPLYWRRVSQTAPAYSGAVLSCLTGRAPEKTTALSADHRMIGPGVSFSKPRTRLLHPRLYVEVAGAKVRRAFIRNDNGLR